MLRSIARISCGLLIVVLASCKTGKINAQSNKGKHTKYVNTFIGTAPLTDSAILGYVLPTGWRSWAGLVYPGTSLPHAMVQLSPITEYGSGAGYEYEDNVIRGFAHTNKGHWNLCNIPVLPVSKVLDSTTSYLSHFSHAKEKAGTAYYEVYLDDYEVKVRLTSTLRCGFHEYTYQDNKDRRIVFDLARSNNRVSEWGIDLVGKHVLQGFQKTHEGKIYFYAIVNKEIARLDKRKENKRDGQAIVHIADGEAGPVEMRIALSFVSSENAKLNLEQEIGSRSFADIQKEGNDKWEALLSRIDVTGGTDKKRQLFYSSFYRSFLWPTLRSDVNGEYTDVKESKAKAEWNYYTVPSLWDTYRNKEVLSGLMLPDVTLDVIRSLKDMGDKTGFIPTFFHGDHAASFIAGSYLRGIDGFDVKGAYQLLLRNATIEGGTRPHIKEYMEKGYISDPDVEKPWVETKGKAGVSKTLEYAYDDYSLAQLANKLGDSANYRIMMQRSGNFKNVFDPATSFMRGRLENGEWIKNFNPQYPYYEYMYREANAWQVSFFAPHDMKGLVALYGGASGFEKKLDSFFTAPWNPTYIARNVESMIGQYCHGNQPDHEAPFSYHFIGKPEKSQHIIDTILNSLYGIGADGLALCGMDDAGEMSSWYVFCALGLYPFSPTDDRFIVTVPIFDKVEWSLSSGKKLTVRKTGPGRKLTAILVNGKAIEGYFVEGKLFREGGEIEIRTVE